MQAFRDGCFPAELRPQQPRVDCVGSPSAGQDACSRLRLLGKKRWYKVSRITFAGDVCCLSFWYGGFKFPVFPAGLSDNLFDCLPLRGADASRAVTEMFACSSPREMCLKAALAKKFNSRSHRTVSYWVGWGGFSLWLNPDRSRDEWGQFSTPRAPASA